MTKIKFIFLAIIFAGVNISIVRAQLNVNADEKAVLYLRKFNSDYAKGIQSKQAELFQGYYADNIRLMPEFQKTVMGKSNALSYNNAFSTRFDVLRYVNNPLETLDLGSQVVELGMFTMTVKFKTTGKEYELIGKYQNFWEKLKEGKLSLITMAWNYNHPTEIAEQLRFTQVPAVNIALEAHLPINSNISFELAALNRLSELTITQHDAKIWAQFYTNDTKLCYSNHPIYHGRKEVDSFLERHVKEIGIFEKLDIRNDRIDMLGNYTVEYASHIANWRNGEYSGINTGKNITIWRREQDGSLKIYRGMAMYD